MLRNGGFLKGGLFPGFVYVGGFLCTVPPIYAQTCLPSGSSASGNSSTNLLAPAFLDAWTAKYPTSTLPARMNTLTGRTCNVCHNPAAFNAPGNCYREDMIELLQLGNTPEAAIDQLDSVDSDGDGFPNGQEILAARAEAGQIGFNPGLVGSLGTDPCGDDPKAAASGVAETPAGPPVPAVSDWGLIASALLLASAGTLILRRRACVSCCEGRFR